ncbi:MAG TPA: hypothetical protein VGH20_10120 [Myxococcales bacterium]
MALLEHRQRGAITCRAREREVQIVGVLWIRFRCVVFGETARIDGEARMSRLRVLDHLPDWIPLSLRPYSIIALHRLLSARKRCRWDARTRAAIRA